MANQRGKCTNFGNCVKADSGDFIDIPPGGTPVCPICNKPLTLVPSSSGRNPSGLLAIIGVLVVIGVLFAAFKLITGLSHRGGPDLTAQTTPGSAGDMNTSPSGGSSAPALNPGDALMFYERSAEPWINEASKQYNSQHPDQPKIVLDFRGSRDGKQEILYGKSHPVIWNPADAYWIDKLNMDWTNPKYGNQHDPIAPESHTILTTRFVLVAWDDRAKVLQAAMQQPRYRGKTWALLHDIATKGWTAAGGPASWGKLKLAQSDPIRSNGGQTALALMFAEYLKSHPGDQPDSPGFVAFMRGIEGAVTKFDETTSKSLDTMLKAGQGQYDIATAYEVNSIAAIDKGQTGIKILYPSPTVEIDFPAAVLKASWVSDSQAAMGKSFVDFLLSRDVQHDSLKYGFRPALSDMRADVDNAFSSGPRGAAGFDLDPVTVVRPVGVKGIDGLLYEWNKIYGSGGH